MVKCIYYDREKNQNSNRDLNDQKAQALLMIYVHKNKLTGTSLVVQYVRLLASQCRGMSSIPGRRTKIPHAIWHGRKIKIEL